MSLPEGCASIHLRHLFQNAIRSSSLRVSRQQSAAVKTKTMSPLDLERSQGGVPDQRPGLGRHAVDEFRA